MAHLFNVYTYIFQKYVMFHLSAGLYATTAGEKSPLDGTHISDNGVGGGGLSLSLVCQVGTL